ncbi:hypothetical protein, partial [Zavarzinella formosa]|uniref:hypothetical protein n=1 Tax=Zavarzinella formosa TaxID=360055 RepID=UPI001EE6928B
MNRRREEEGGHAETRRAASAKTWDKQKGHVAGLMDRLDFVAAAEFLDKSAAVCPESERAKPRPKSPSDLGHAPLLCVGGPAVPRDRLTGPAAFR